MAEAAKAANPEAADSHDAARAAKVKAGTWLTSMTAGMNMRIQRTPIGAKVADGKEDVGKDQEVRAKEKEIALTKAPRAKEKEKEKAFEEKAKERIPSSLLLQQ